MKYQNIIRILAGLSFLIFFCPFFQMCDDEQRKESFTANAYDMSIFRKLYVYDTMDVSWGDAFFTSIILSSMIILIKSFKNYSFSLRFFCYFNLSIAISIIFTFAMITLLERTGPFGNIIRLKYGFYLFLINTIAIIILSKKQYNLQN